MTTCPPQCWSTDEEKAMRIQPFMKWSRVKALMFATVALTTALQTTSSAYADTNLGSPFFWGPVQCGSSTQGFYAQVAMNNLYSIYSPSGRYRLVFQGDGNLVAYHTGVAIWQSGTNRPGVQITAFQCDGNVVIYGNTGAIWSTGTSTRFSSTEAFWMQDDGNVVLYRYSDPNSGLGGSPIWQSNSAGR